MLLLCVHAKNTFFVENSSSLNNSFFLRGADGVL
jgi:hypothetical protein